MRYVLEGSVQRIGDMVRINAQLIEAVSGHHMWAENYDQPAQDLFALQKDITRNIVGTIGSESGGLMQAELDRIAHSSTDNLTAYDFYLRVVAHDLRRTKEDNVLARRMFDSYLQDVWGDWAESREQALCERRSLRDRPSKSTHLNLGAMRFSASPISSGRGMTKPFL